MTEDLYVDSSDLKKYRTEIPNIVFDIGLHPLSLAIYCYIKRRAGAHRHGACTEGAPKSAKKLGMTKPTFLKYRELLTKPHPKLNDKPLITMEQMHAEDGGDRPNRVTINDIWPENFATLSQKTGGVHDVHQGGKRDLPGGSKRFTPGVKEIYPKKEPYKKEPIEEVESQLADASRRRATFLFEKIKSINPKAKKPNIEAWAKDIEKLMRIDGRTEEEVTRVIEWVFNDDFWCKNILSGRKLREKFDQLYINMVKHKESPKKKEEDAAKKKANMCRKNKEWAIKFLVDKNFDSLDNKLTLKDNGVEVKFNGSWQIIGFLENGFQEQIQNFYRKMAA